MPTNKKKNKGKRRPARQARPTASVAPDSQRAQRAFAPTTSTATTREDSNNENPEFQEMVARAMGAPKVREGSNNEDPELMEMAARVISASEKTQEAVYLRINSDFMTKLLEHPDNINFYTVGKAVPGYIDAQIECKDDDYKRMQLVNKLHSQILSREDLHMADRDLVESKICEALDDLHTIFLPLYIELDMQLELYRELKLQGEQELQEEDEKEKPRKTVAIDLDRLTKLAEKPPHKSNAKRLLKAVPDFAECRKNNPHAISEMVEGFENMLNGGDIIMVEGLFESMQKDREDPDFLAEEESAFDFIRSLARLSARRIAPAPGHTATQSVVELRGFLQSNLELLMARVVEHVDGVQDLIRLIRCPMVAVMQYFEAQIIRCCFYDDEESFRSHKERCEEMTEEELMQFADQLAVSKLDPNKGLGKEIRLRNGLWQAASDVKRGMDMPNTACWQCGQERISENNKQLVCHGKKVGCEVATYCSRDCQLKHWTGGHKTTCKIIKKWYKWLEEQMDIIDNAFVNQEDHEERYGMKPSVLDYELCVANAILGYWNDARKKPEDKPDDVDAHEKPKDKPADVAMGDGGDDDEVSKDKDADSDYVDGEVLLAKSILGSASIAFFYQNIKYFIVEEQEWGVDLRKQVSPDYGTAHRINKFLWSHRLFMKDYTLLIASHDLTDRGDRRKALYLCLLQWDLLKEDDELEDWIQEWVDTYKSQQHEGDISKVRRSQTSRFRKLLRRAEWEITCNGVCGVEILRDMLVDH